MNKQKNRLLRSPFKGISYRLHVDYWIQFYPKYGIHDACNSKSCWRKEFGGQDYKARGSHGCVNTPYDAVKWLYDWALIDTAVRVQK
jgi:lipoprotein-anchoring transpeptidase ErfK/SrfK